MASPDGKINVFRIHGYCILKVPVPYFGPSNPIGCPVYGREVWIGPVARLTKLRNAIVEDLFLNLSTG